MNELLLKDKLRQSMSYEQYHARIDALLLENKTTGENHSEAMLGYTRLNVQRMKRVEKTLVLTTELKNCLAQLNDAYIWMVITEAWCGDAAYAVPALKKMADATGRVELRLILRDEHPELIDAYLTHGSRSIPKLICIHAESGTETGTWGPRPEPAQKLFLDWKALTDRPPYREITQALQLWYARDKGLAMQAEIAARIKQWQAVTNC